MHGGLTCAGRGPGSLRPCP